MVSGYIHYAGTALTDNSTWTTTTATTYADNGTCGGTLIVPPYTYYYDTANSSTCDTTSYTVRYRAPGYRYQAGEYIYYPVYDWRQEYQQPIGEAIRAPSRITIRNHDDELMRALLEFDQPVVTQGAEPASLTLENLQEAYRRLGNRPTDEEWDAARYQAQAEWTEAQRQVVEREQQRAREQQEAERQRVQVKESKGEALLRDIIGDTDFEHFKRHGHIDIQSPNDATKRYRIRTQRRIGIVKLENGQWVEKALSLCIHPDNQFAWAKGDLVATHVLLAKYNEEMLNKVANLHKMAA